VCIPFTELNPSAYNLCDLPKWSKTGVTVAGTGEGGNQSNQLEHPTGIFIDAHDNLLIADTMNNRVQRFAPSSKDGTTLVGGIKAGAGENELDGPSDVFVDASGNVLVADTHNARIQKLVVNRTEVVTAISLENNELLRYVFLFVDEKGNIYTTETPATGRNRISVIAKYEHGSFSRHPIISNSKYVPKGIFVDRCSNVYVASADRHVIEKHIHDSIWYLEGESIENSTVGMYYLIEAGIPDSAGSKLTQLNSPWDITIDKYGYAFIADTMNHRVIRVRTGGGYSASVVAGILEEAGSDGVHLNEPVSVAIDSKWNLFVSDTLNHRVQRFDFQGGDVYC
jgi:hypothetical protein